jgi:predicted DCC family thiol-disulfide oxidoreductase YuxK
MNTLTIFYDPRCGLCSRFRRWMQAQASYVQLAFVPYDSPLARSICPCIDHMRADEEIVIMADDGRLWQGAAAWVTCLWALQDYREWSARLAQPHMQGLAKKVVRWVSSNRIGLSSLLHFPSDAELNQPMVCSDGSCTLPR